MTGTGWDAPTFCGGSETPSDLGDWSYEIIDTKLARETKGGTVLQLCLYAQLLAAMQGVEPEFVYVVAPWSDFHPQQFRVADYMAFFRKAQCAAQTAVDGGADPANTVYPDPKTIATYVAGSRNATRAGGPMTISVWWLT